MASMAAGLSREGFNVFLSGGNGQSLTVEGLPVDSNQNILLESFKMNLGLLFLKVNAPLALTKPFFFFFFY